jgi:hypothetical protein
MTVLIEHNKIIKTLRIETEISYYDKNYFDVTHKEDGSIIVTKKKL